MRKALAFGPAWPLQFMAQARSTVDGGGSALSGAAPTYIDRRIRTIIPTYRRARGSAHRGGRGTGAAGPRDSPGALSRRR